MGTVLGGSKLPNWESILEKTRVGFGSPELSLRLSCTECSALESGHGPRRKGFHGGSFGREFCIFGGSTIETNMKMQYEIG